MDLWIRSQNKNILTPIKEPLEIKSYEDEKGNDFYDILYVSYCLGTYKAKERALEVLDEIEMLMKSTTAQNSFISTYCQNMIYEMPKE